MAMYFLSALFLPFVGLSVRLQDARFTSSVVGHSEKSSDVSCDFRMSVGLKKMAPMDDTGVWKPVFQVANATNVLSFTLGNGVTKFQDGLNSDQCLTHCSVIDYQNLPPKHAKYWQKSCQNSFAHAFGTDLQDNFGNLLVDSTEKVSKIFSTDGKKQLYKLCCASEMLGRPVSKEGRAEVTIPSGTRPRSLIWEDDEFAAYGVFDSDVVKNFFSSKLHGLAWIWKLQGEDAYMAKMREIWVQADKVQPRSVDSSATLIFTYKNPWKVHVWWVGDSRAKVLDSDVSIEGHLCKKEMGSKLKSQPLKSVYSPFGWMCCVERSAGKSCTRLSRSLGAGGKWPGINGEPEFVDWTSMVSPGSVVMIASHTLWEGPLNKELNSHWLQIAGAYKGGKTQDAIAVIAATNWKNRIQPLAEMSQLQKISAAKEVEMITTPLLRAAEKGKLQMTLETIVRETHAWKAALANKQGKGRSEEDTTAVVFSLKS